MLRRLTTAKVLPALSTPDHWDSNDGNTGLHYQIMCNMSDVELQIQETINTVLEDYLEAQHIAWECPHQSKRLALELCQFITLGFQKWKHRDHSKRDACKMTAMCVRWIFKEFTPKGWLRAMCTIRGIQLSLPQNTCGPPGRPMR